MEKNDNGFKTGGTADHLEHPQPLYWQHLRSHAEQKGLQHNGCSQYAGHSRGSGNGCAGVDHQQGRNSEGSPSKLLKQRLQLSCSNLAWRKDEEDAALATLIDLGYSGIEIAPTRIWDHWDGASSEEAVSYRKRLADQGFSIPSMQAIYFGLDNVSLFNPDTHGQLIARTLTAARFADAFECPVMVFGAPRMRDPGKPVDDEVIEQASAILTRLAQIAYEHNTTFCIEPNAREYGCRFIWTVNQAAELVKLVGHPGFGLHVDAAAMSMECEDGPATIHEFAPMVRHFHVSEPQLRGLANPKIDHKANLTALADSGYTGWVSLESTDVDAFEQSVSTLASWVKAC